MAEWLVNQIPSTADTNATTTLSSTLTAGATTMSVASETKMPTAGYTARAVLSYGSSAEIVAVTGAASGPYTITRAQEGTSASEWPTGTQVNVVMTAAGLLNWIQANDFTANGDWTFGGVNPLVTNDLTVNGAMIASGVDDGVIGITFTSADGDGVDATYVYGYTVGAGLYLGGAKVGTDADVDLELKSGSGTGTNQGTVYINGGLKVKAVYKTANYSADHGDYFIGYTTLAAARTVTLPLKSTVANGQKLVIADLTTGTGAGTNNIIVNEHATDGGSTVATINVDRARVEIEIQNSSWWASPISAAWTRTA